MNSIEENENKEHSGDEREQYIQKELTSVVKKKKGKVAKIIKRIFASLMLLIAITITVGYLYVFRSGFLEKQIIENFPKFANGTIAIKVKQASLFRGFIFEDIVIRSDDKFDKRPVFEMKRFSLLYNVYGFFTGEFGVNEIGIYKPKITLIQKKNIWNIQALMKPSDAKEEKKKKEKKKEDKKAEGDVPKEISLPFSVRVFFKFVLEDFHLVIEGADKSNKKPISAKIENFTFRTHILTEKFDTIPLNPSAIRLIDTFLIQLVPNEKIHIMFSNKEMKTKMPFNLHWLLALDGNEDSPKFYSRIKIGANKIPMKFKGRQILPLNFMLDYKMKYNPEADVLNLYNFTVLFQNDKLLNLTGKITDVTKPKKMAMDIVLDESNINLNKLYPVYRTFTGDRRMKFAGKVSLAPLTIQGPMNDLKIKGRLSLKRIYFRQPGLRARLPYFNLNYDLIYSNEVKGLAPLKYAKINWQGKFNGSRLTAKIHFIPSKKVNVSIGVRNFAPAAFSKGFLANGLFHVQLNVNGRSVSHTRTRLRLWSSQFQYRLNRGKSGINKLDFKTNIRVDSPNIVKSKRIRVRVSQLDLFLKNGLGQDGVWLNSGADVNLRGKKIKLSYKLKALGVNIRHLYPALTGQLQESFDSLKEMFKKSITLNGQTDVDINGSKIQLNHLTNIVVPDFGVNDLALKADVNIKPKLIKIKEVVLTGLKKALLLKINGQLKEKKIKVFVPYKVKRKSKKNLKSKKTKGRMKVQKIMDPTFNVSLFFGKKQLEKIFQENAIKGDLNLLVHLKNDIAKGSLKINHLFFTNGPMKVNDINMNFPFEYNIKMHKPLNLTKANKERIIKNYNFNKDYNFTIQSVIMPHPITNKPFKIIYPQGKFPAFSAGLYFKDNVFQLPHMRIFVLSGLITAHDILFNLGRGRSDEMQFTSLIKIKDIDLTKLMPADRVEGIKDGVIRMDINAYSNTMVDVINNLYAQISIYKIGQEFGKTAVNVVMQDSANMLVDGIVNNSLSVKDINLVVRDGLVYARIGIKKGIVGYIVGPDKNEIVQDRIPISAFMSKAKSEASIYSSVEKK